MVKHSESCFLGVAEQMKEIIHKQAQQIMLREPQNNDIIH